MRAARAAAPGCRRGTGRVAWAGRLEQQFPDNFDEVVIDAHAAVANPAALPASHVVRG